MLFHVTVEEVFFRKSSWAVELSAGEWLIAGVNTNVIFQVMAGVEGFWTDCALEFKLFDVGVFHMNGHLFLGVVDFGAFVALETMGIIGKSYFCET